MFVRLRTDDSKAVCINDNGLFCIKSNDYDNSVLALKNHFGESTCSGNSSGFTYYSASFNCSAYSYGSVTCSDASTREICNGNRSGSVNCA